MKAYYGEIEKLTEHNNYFRQVLYTGKYCQLVLMCLKPGEEIGLEVHDTVDQFFRIEKGVAKFTVNESEEYVAKEGDAVIIPAGSKHNVINTGHNQDLKLYTVYSPPNHPDGTVHKTKAEAVAAETEHHH
ncbi:cupin domain-containing protein [Patescibacteria group bacterium]